MKRALFRVVHAANSWRPAWSGRLVSAIVLATSSVAGAPHVLPSLPQATAQAATTPTGQWLNVTPSNVDLIDALSCSNFGTISVVADPLRPTDLYSQFNCQGVWKSTDYGQTWHGPINTGSGGAGASGAGGLAIAPGATGAPPILYSAGIRGTGLGFWRSLDGGISWTNFNVAPGGSRQDFYPPTVDPHDANHLIMAGHEMNLLVQSSDGGQTWSSISMAGGMNENGGTAFLFFIDTGDAATTRNTWLYMAQGTGGAVGTWRTGDGGASWTQVDTNEHPHGDAQIYQPDTSGIVYMAGIYSAKGWGVLRSTDYGQTWSHVGNGGSEAVVFGTPNTVYAEYGWACGIGCSVPPTLETAPQPGTDGWTSPATPAGMTQGPAQSAVVYDGSYYNIITANWAAGLWRYAEPASGAPAPTAAATTAPTSTSTTVPPTSTPLPAAPAPAAATPTQLPNHFAFGLGASPSDTWMSQTGIPWDYRMQYLAGGVNTGSGWENWNTSGQFALYYAQGSAQHGYIPLFPYYELLQSSGTCGSCGEAQKDITNLNTPSLMAAYYQNFALLMQRLGPGSYDGITGYGKAAVVLVEPDFTGGYAYQATNLNQCFGYCSGQGNDPSLLKASVSSTGVAEVASFANTYAGYVQALAHLRDLYAPNVVLGLDVSMWAPGDDLGLDPSSGVNAAGFGQQVGSFLSRTGPHELVMNNPLDRDAGQYMALYGQNRWWDRLNVTFPNFARWEQYLQAVGASDAGKSILLWQVPLGNQYFDTENNTNGHYQDNRAEYVFGHVPELIQAGIVGAVFAAGNSGNTMNTDALGDGITNPPSFCTSAGVSSGQACNAHTSNVSDDDGGYVRMMGAAYYKSPVSLRGGSATATPTPSSTPPPTNTPAPTLTNVPPAATATVPPTPVPTIAASPAPAAPGLWATITPPVGPGFNSVVTDPTAPDTVYAGTNAHGIFRSTNAGATWTKIDSGSGSNLVDAAQVWGLVVDPFNHLTLYAASGTPLKSTDGGINWTQILPPAVAQQIGTTDVYAIALDPNLPNHVLASFKYFWNGAGDSGIIESFDGGATWTVHNPPTGGGWGAINSVWFLDNSQTWLVGSQAAGLWRTTNSGQSWTQVSGMRLENGAASALYRNAKTGSLYIAVWNGILRSTDDGVTWQAFTAGLPYAGYDSLIGDGTNLYTAPAFPTTGDNGQSHGPWYTAREDGSTAWSAYSTQTTCVNGVCNGPARMAYDGAANTLYSANWDAGIVRNQLGGAPAPSPATSTPTAAPSATPTTMPTSTATAMPTNTPTALPSNTPTPAPTNTPTSVPTAPAAFTPTAVPTSVGMPGPIGTYTTSATVSPTSIRVGFQTRVSLSTSVTSTSASSVLVDLEVYNASGVRIFQQFWDNQSFAAGQTQTYGTTWTTPRTLPAGVYTVKVGVFSCGWGTLYAWKDNAASITNR